MSGIKRKNRPKSAKPISSFSVDRIPQNGSVSQDLLVARYLEEFVVSKEKNSKNAKPKSNKRFVNFKLYIMNIYIHNMACPCHILTRFCLRLLKAIPFLKT